MSSGKFRRVAITFMTIMSLLGLQLSPAYAGMVTTETLLAQEKATLDTAQLESFLGREDVRDQLARLGVTPTDVEERLANLTTTEIAALNERLDNAPAGGVLGVLLLLFVVFVITDMLGATDIFPFVRPIR